MQTKKYTVTKLAGPRVAGRAVKLGEVLELTNEQAEAELLTGAIVEDEVDKKDLKPAKAEDTAELKKLRDRAKGLDDDTDAAIEAATPPVEPPPVEPPPVKPATTARKAGAQA